MAKSQQTQNKKEKEKAKLKKREEKRKKREARKAEKSTGIEFAYVDFNGNLVDTPPDPSMKEEIDADEIVLGVPPKEEGEGESFDPVRKGKVSFYDSSKGFGFIIDNENQEKYFTHVSGIIDEITENDQVSFELEKGQRGMNAVQVKKV